MSIPIQAVPVGVRVKLGGHWQMYFPLVLIQVPYLQLSGFRHSLTSVKVSYK